MSRHVICHDYRGIPTMDDIRNDVYLRVRDVLLRHHRYGFRYVGTLYRNEWRTWLFVMNDSVDLKELAGERY